MRELLPPEEALGAVRARITTKREPTAACRGAVRELPTNRSYSLEEGGALREIP